MAEKFTYITLEETASVLTKEKIIEQLKYLGVQKGMTLLVQGDMKQLGTVVGGEQSVIEALMETVGFEGTIVMPSFTFGLLDPSSQKKKVERQYWKAFRNGLEPFDRRLSVEMDEDTLVQQFLRNDGVARSYHPIYSFAAWGKYARIFCDKHPLHFGLNQDSPLGKMVDFNGFVVLLGTSYEKSVMFQLAKYKGDQFPVRIISAPIRSGNKKEWKDLLDISYDSKKGIKEAMEYMEEKKVVRTTFLGKGCCRFFSCREALQAAVLSFSCLESL